MSEPTEILFGLVLGLTIAAVLYLAVFGTLARLIRRDEGNAPITNSFDAARRRTRNEPPRRG